MSQKSSGERSGTALHNVAEKFSNLLTTFVLVKCKAPEAV